MLNFCVICNLEHESPKWYNSKEGNGLICKKAYLKQYHDENKETINEERKKRYQEDDQYRKEVNERNNENDKKRRASGYVRVRKPRSEWTEDEKRKAIEAKQRYKEKHPERIIEQNKQSHAKHYQNNIDEYKKINYLIRKGIKNQFSHLKADAERRNIIFDITFEQYEKKRNQPCHYCKRQLDETGSCLDRIDSKMRIYNDKNTVPCCSICNYLKGIYLTEEETLFAVLALKKYHYDKVIPEKINFALYESKSQLTPHALFVKFNLNIVARGLQSSLTEKDYIALLRKPCFYCDGEVTGLDRLENKEDYDIGNCVPCCNVCNRIKADIFDYEETFVMVNAIQKIRRFNQEKSKEKICVVCSTKESSKWIKHPEIDQHLCTNHYIEIFEHISNHYNLIIDTHRIYNAYYENIKNNRFKNIRTRDYNPMHSKNTYDGYKQLIESRQMILLTTLDEYLIAAKHKKLTIRCVKGHIFERCYERVKSIGTCPDCEGLSNKGGSYKEKIKKTGWEYISGEYITKNSILTVQCKHGQLKTKKYLWLRDNRCDCKETIESPHTTLVAPVMC